MEKAERNGEKKVRKGGEGGREGFRNRLISQFLHQYSRLIWI